MRLIDLRQRFGVEIKDEAPAWDFHGTVFAPRLRSRIDVRFSVIRKWGAGKDSAIAALKQAKRGLPAELVERIAGEMVEAITAAYGHWTGCIVPVACGHSRRRDGLSFRLGQAVAERLGAEFVEAFEFRPVTGSSHPKQFDRLPPLNVIEVPSRPAIVVDDVATSGWHMREAMNALRERGVQASGLAWIGK